MMVRTLFGKSAVAVPFATMASAEQLASGGWRVTASSGEVFSFTESEWQSAISDQAAVVLPASAGTYVLAFNIDRDDPPFWRENVIGWSIAFDSTIRPLVTDKYFDASSWTVLHPDGSVESNSGDRYRDVAAWLASFDSNTPDQ